MKQQLLTLLIALMASSGLMSAANGIGKFSISATQQVIFSPGNLQYNAALGTHQCADGTTKQGTWRFAPNQWDIVGGANKNISSTYNGWIDLFGFGTSGWKSGANAYQPWSTNSYYEDYYPGGSKYNHITGNYAKADWGVYNQIGNDAPGTWRTLTGNEWMYLLHGRTKAASLFGLGIVNGVRGIIILPDDWVTPSGVTFYAGSGSWLDNCYYNKNGNDFSHNVFVSGPSGTWDAMAASGAVFLPASGNRSGYTSLSYTGTGGYYWSSTVQSTQNYTYASDMYFRDEFLVPSGLGNRNLGCAVRLVRLPSQLDDNPETYTITWKNWDGTTLATTSVLKGATPSYTGSTPTRPSTAEYAYTFSGWTPAITAATANKTYTATYTATPRYTITFNANGGLIPTGGNMGNTPSGHITTLSADRTSGTVVVTKDKTHFQTMANDCPSREGYTFAGWYTDPTSGVQVYDNTGYRVVGTYWNSEGKWIGTSNVTLYAHWTPIPYTITVNSSNVSQGSASGGGTYDYGTNHQTTATPNECYRFVQWSDGNTDNPRTITVTGDATYTAEFEQIQYTIEAQSADAGQGSATVTNP